MLTPVDCIALRTVRVSDSKNLLSAWTRQAGRITFSIPAGNGREARRRRAFTVPLGTFQAVADLRPNREIAGMRDVSPMAGSLAMGGSPLHGVTAIFLSEVLDNMLRRSEPDEALSAFLFQAIELFASLPPESIYNFHIVFLYHLASYAGIAPDTDTFVSRRTTPVFDLREARFRAAAPLHGDYIEGNETRFLTLLARSPLSASHRLPLRRAERNRALDLILRYISIHLTPLDSLHSLEILRGM